MYERTVRQSAAVDQLSASGPASTMESSVVPGSHRSSAPLRSAFESSDAWLGPTSTSRYSSTSDAGLNPANRWKSQLPWYGQPVMRCAPLPLMRAQPSKQSSSSSGHGIAVSLNDRDADGVPDTVVPSGNTPPYVTELGVKPIHDEGAPQLPDAIE